MRKKYSASMVGFKSRSLLFLKKIFVGQVLLVGPLIPLFWTSGDVSPGFQSQGRSLACMPLSPACNEFLRFTSCVTPADCIEVSMAAEPFRSTCTQQARRCKPLGHSGSASLLYCHNCSLNFRLFVNI